MVTTLAWGESVRCMFSSLSVSFKSKYLDYKRSPFQDFLGHNRRSMGMRPGVVIYFCLLLASGSWRSSHASTEPFFAHMATCVGEPIIAVKVPERERTALTAWNNLFSSGVHVQPGHGSSFFHLFDKARKIAGSTPILLRRWKRCLKAVCVPNTDLQSISCRTLYYSYNPFRHACVPQKGFCERTMNHFATMGECQHVCSSGSLKLEKPEIVKRLSRVPDARTVGPAATRIKLRIQRENDGVTTTLVNSTLKVAREKSLLLIGYILPEPTHVQNSVAAGNQNSAASASKHPDTTHSVAKSNNGLSKPATEPSDTLAGLRLSRSAWPQGKPESMHELSSRALPVTDSFGKYMHSYRNQIPSWPPERNPFGLFGTPAMLLPHISRPGSNRIPDSRTPDAQLRNEVNEVTTRKSLSQRTKQYAKASDANMSEIPALQPLSARNVELQEKPGLLPLPSNDVPLPVFGVSPENLPLRRLSRDSRKGVPASPAEKTANASAAKTPVKRPETSGAVPGGLKQQEKMARLATDAPSSATQLLRQGAMGPPLWPSPLRNPMFWSVQQYSKEEPRREPVVEERIIPKTAPQTGIRTIYEYPIRGRPAGPPVKANP